MKIFLRALCRLLLGAVLVLPAAAFSAEDVISPLPGVWGNVQPLVLNVPDGSELYYSLTGSDPLLSGFAYDGPVIIEQKGDVRVKIAAVSKDGRRSDVTVSYTVRDVPLSGASPDAIAFVRTISENPLRRYVSGTLFSIPPEFSFSLYDDAGRFVPGTALSLSEKNTWERYVPLTVRSAAGTGSWHFVMHVVAADAEALRRRSVPFAIQNWTTLVLGSRKYSYQLDDGDWMDGETELTLERFSEHTLRWKVSGSPESASVFSYRLPPMPQLRCTGSGDGCAVFSLQPAVRDYSSVPFLLARPAGSQSLDGVAEGQFRQLVADTFAGDELEGVMRAGVYYDGVYQGTLEAPFSLDRRPPAPPVIMSSTRNAFLHSQVSVSISAEQHADIYVAVSEPLEFEIESEERNRASFDAVQTGQFVLYDGKDLLFSSVSDHATFYKIHAYAVDAAGNRSYETEYRVVVDELNFYLRPSASVSSEIPDGSYNRPFTSFAQAVEAINASSNMRLHVSGNIPVGGAYTIRSSCTILGSHDTLLFAEGEGLRIEGSQVEIRNCVLDKASSRADDTKLLTVSGSTLTLRNCDVKGQFRQNGMLVEASSSKLYLDNAAFAVQAPSYACAVSVRNTDCSVSQGGVSAAARTAVVFCVSGGKFSLRNSTLAVTCRTGRCLELVRAEASLSDNSFAARPLYAGAAGKPSVLPVWKDADTVVREERGNTTDGF